MDKDIALDTYLLRPYFKDFSFSNEKHSIKIDLMSSPGQYGFAVRMEMKEPGYNGAYHLNHPATDNLIL